MASSRTTAKMCRVTQHIFAVGGDEDAIGVQAEVARARVIPDAALIHHEKPVALDRHVRRHSAAFNATLRVDRADGADRDSHADL